MIVIQSVPVNGTGFFLPLNKLDIVCFLQREERLWGNSTMEKIPSLVWQNNGWKGLLFGVLPKAVIFQVEAM